MSEKDPLFPDITDMYYSKKIGFDKIKLELNKDKRCAICGVKEDLYDTYIAGIFFGYLCKEHRINTEEE